MRVLVLGGAGFFGRRVVTALRAQGADVAISGRRGEVAIDVEHVDASQLARYDVVINCTDTLAAPPDRLHAAALAAGVIYLEPTAEPGPIVHALAKRTQLTGDGVAVLGVGIFPGLSNLAAHAAFDANGGHGPIEVAMQFSPFTAAGAGMVALIAHLMAEPAPCFIGGKREIRPAFSSGKPMPFGGSWSSTLRAAIPETDLLHETLDTPDVVALLSPTPTIMMPLLRLAAILVPPWKPLKRAYLAMLRVSVGLLRRVLFRKRPTHVVVSALAGRHGDAHEGQFINLATPDGISCGAYAIAAAAALLVAKRPAPGTHILDALVTLDEILAAIAAIPGAPAIEVTRSSPAPAAASATA
jgi:hypothetical protein